MALTRARARGGGGRFESTEQEWLQAPLDPDAAGGNGSKGSKAAGAGGLHRVGFSNGGAPPPLQANSPPPPPPPPAASRTDWTRLVPRSVLTGHVSSRLPLQAITRDAPAAARRIVP